VLKNYRELSKVEGENKSIRSHIVGRESKGKKYGRKKG